MRSLVEQVVLVGIEVVVAGALLGRRLGRLQQLLGELGLALLGPVRR